MRAACGSLLLLIAALIILAPLSVRASGPRVAPPLEIRDHSAACATFSAENRRGAPASVAAALPSVRAALNPARPDAECLNAFPPGFAAPSNPWYCGDNQCSRPPPELSEYAAPFL